MWRAFKAWCRGLVSPGFVDRHGTQVMGTPCWLCENRAAVPGNDSGLCRSCDTWVEENAA
jgi:hypothetical protein